MSEGIEATARERDEGAYLFNLPRARGWGEIEGIVQSGALDVLHLHSTKNVL